MGKVHLGSISTGTLRTEDLLEAFAWELNYLAKQEPQNHAHLLLASEADTQFSDDMTDEEYEQASYVVQDLQDALNEYCPPFVYFGTLPGDGADFGFWPDLDALDDARRYSTAMPDGEEWLEEDEVILQVNDHGNVMLMDKNRKELWGVV